MLKQETFEYKDDDVTLEGYFVYDDKASGKQPAVLVAHDWSGKNELALNSANRLATFGYVGVAIDMFGKGKIGKTKEEKTALIQPFVKDRAKLQKRILTGFDAAKKLPQVDGNKIGAIGFCFGGLVVLDLARSGAAVKGVASFHGLLNAPENTTQKTIQAKILVLHGYDDPMVKPDQVIKFCDEMTKAKVDWEVDMYGHVMHAFANPQANDPGFGTVYNKQAETRAWLATQNFFKEIFV